MFAGVLDALLYGDYMLQLDISLDPSSCLSYQYNGLLFQNTQTQGNLVKELHLSCCSSRRSAAYQICMRKRSEEDIVLKSFKRR